MATTSADSLASGAVTVIDVRESAGLVHHNGQHSGPALEQLLLALMPWNRVSL